MLNNMGNIDTKEFNIQIYFTIFHNKLILPQA